MFPRFQGDDLIHNQRIASTLAEIAAARDVTLPQLAIAWVAAQGEDIVPVVGSRTAEQVAATVSSNGVRLSADDLAVIDSALADSEVRGDRYPSEQMMLLGQRTLRTRPVGRTTPNVHSAFKAAAEGLLKGNASVLPRSERPGQPHMHRRPELEAGTR